MWTFTAEGLAIPRKAFTAAISSTQTEPYIACTLPFTTTRVRPMPRLVVSSLAHKKARVACRCYCMAINQVPRLIYLLYMLPADGPSNFGGIQYRLMTALPVEPAVFQLSYTTTYSPATIVRWTYNGNMANGTTFQVVTDLLLSTYQNVLVVTGKMAGVYTCTVTTTCAPACGSFTGPRSVTASLTIPGTYAGGYFKN